VRALIARVRHAHTVLEGWGFAGKVARGGGVAALFSGPPGTGKTMAAGIIARALDLELYQVDLSRVVSKWVGETEKQLARVFEAAEAGHALLLFDEADALFARRTQVRDSNDRYANLETGYLLQRLEGHDGVVVLATNRRQDIDSAFLRRFEVVIEFTAPGVTEREQLWQRHLPAGDRCATDVDPAALARLFELSGGQIRNAIMTSVAGTAVDERGGLIAAPPRLAMFHLIGGATRELLRAGRLVNPADYGDWADAVRAAFAPNLPAPGPRPMP
jgi:ATP-dependent 26S proteasome regulatory subunit